MADDHGVGAHGGAHRGIHDGRRRFLDHLLPPPLRRAVAFAQVNGVPVAVGKHLNLNVACVVNQPFQHQRAITEGAAGFTPRAGQGFGQFGQVTHQPHATAAAAGHGFHQERQAQRPRVGLQLCVRLFFAQIAGRARHASRLHALLGQCLAAHGANGAWRRAYEDQAGVGAGLREVGAF